MQRSILRLVISLSTSALLLIYVLRHFGLGDTFSVMRSARYDYLVTAFALMVLAYLLRGYRWLIWEAELNYLDSFKLILIGFMGNNLLPARLGEVLRAHCTAEKTGQNYGRTAALASITIERVLDGLILSAISILGLLYVSVSRGLFYSLLFVAVVFAGLTTSLIIGIYYQERIRRGLDKIHEIFPGHLTKFGIGKVNYFLDGLMLIKGWHKLGKAILFTAIIWGLECAYYWLMANSMGTLVPLKTCLIFLAAVNFASLFPFTVGGIGAVEGVATVYLMDTGIAGNLALAMVVIQHALQFLFTTGLGGLFYFNGGYYNTLFAADKGSAAPQNPPDAVPFNVINDTRSKMLELSEKFNIEKNSQKDVYLSIVIPSYNEQNRLPKTVLQTVAWCVNNGIDYELILVDDGSKDDTPILGKLFVSRVKDIRYILCPHLGKGAAVRMGMLNATGRRVLFMDADGATPLDEIPKLIAEIDAGSHIAIGSRVAQHPGDTVVTTKWYRRLMGRTFAVLVNILAIPGFGDTQCGFKMFSREVIHDVFSRQKLNGFAFDVEILYIAKMLGFSVLEVPVNWVNQEGSKVNVVTDSVKMLLDITKIRLLHRSEQWIPQKFNIAVKQACECQEF